MDAIDIHGHLIPPAVIEDLLAHPDRHPVRAERMDKGHIRFHVPGEKPTRPCAPSMWGVDDRLAWMDRAGIGRQANGGWVDTFGYEMAAADCAAWSRYLNVAMAEQVAATPRLIGLATVPLQDGELAAAELRHAVRTLGLSGAMIGSSAGGRELDAPEVDPFWAAAAELGTMIMLHPSYGGGADRLNLPGFPNVVARPYETALVASRLIFGGVLDRHPGVKLLLVHGGGYLPFQIGRLMHGHRMEKYQVTAPDEQLRRIWYDHILFDPRALRFLAELVGPDRIALGTDYPFPVGDLDPLRVVAPAGLDAAQLRRTAEMLLGL